MLVSLGHIRCHIFGNIIARFSICCTSHMFLYIHLGKATSAFCRFLHFVIPQTFLLRTTTVWSPSMKIFNWWLVNIIPRAWFRLRCRKDISAQRYVCARKALFAIETFEGHVSFLYSLLWTLTVFDLSKIRVYVCDFKSQTFSMLLIMYVWISWNMRTTSNSF